MYVLIKIWLGSSQNAWTKTGYAWFDKRVEDPEVVVTEDAEAEDKDNFVRHTFWTADGDNADNGDDSNGDVDNDDAMMNG